MTEGNTKTIQKEFKKIGTSFKKKRSCYELATPSFKLIEHILADLLKEQLKAEDLKGKKPGLGKLIGLARKNKALPEGLLTRLDGANKIRIDKTAHGSEELLPLKKKEAEEVYFTLAEIVGRTDGKAKLDFVCNACYAGWSRRGNHLCDKCYGERKSIDNTIKKIREKTNEKLEDMRNLHKLFPPAPIKLETISKPGDPELYFPADFLEECGVPIKYTRYGKEVLGKPNRYFRQNKILDELHGKLKQKVIEELKADVEEDVAASRYFEACVLLGYEAWDQVLRYPDWFFNPDDTERVGSFWFDKPKEEFEEIESLLDKRLLKKFDSNTWLSTEDTTQTKMLDILIELEIFFLVSTYHRQLLAKVAIARCGIERNSFLEHMTVCTKEEFSKFLEAVSKIQ